MWRMESLETSMWLIFVEFAPAKKTVEKLSICSMFKTDEDTVDGRNPAPPGMYKTL